MRRSFSKIALAAGISLALALTFSCSSGSDDDGGGGKSSTSGNLYSSSGSSSTLSPCTGGTVKIGTQTWQKCNLNVVPTSTNDAATNSACYDNKESNCAIYGRLYDWATAMALPASYNVTSYYLQIGTKHKGLCPSGWHIPSNVDWNTLMKFVNPNCSDDSSCSEAGIKLRAASGWNDYEGKSGNGTDNYGFSALPSGRGLSDGSFLNVGGSGYWWSADESRDSNAHGWGINSQSYYADYADDFYHTVIDKSDLFSVRCVQD